MVSSDVSFTDEVLAVVESSSSSSNSNNANASANREPSGWPTLRHQGKQSEPDLAGVTPESQCCFWPQQQDISTHTQSNPPLRSDAFMGHCEGTGGDIATSDVLEQYSTDIEVAPGSPSEDAEKRSLDSMEERMANCLLDECIIRGHVKVRRSRYSSNDADDVDGGDDGDRDSDSGSSGVYEMPGDNIDELCMDLYDCGLDEPNLQQPETNNPSCIEADHLQAELSLKNQELAELNAMVESLSAEMLVQRSELEAADRKVSQLEASLQCSICLEPFSQPHSLGCGHTFCMQCLKQWLTQTMQCPTCRSAVSKRPCVAFVVQDVLQCLGLKDEGRSLSVVPIRMGESQDPWQHLFPSNPSGSGSDSYERCRVCLRWTLRGGACPHCDLERIRRRLASSINVEGSTPRSSPSIHMSRLVRRRSQVLASVERLLESTHITERDRSSARSERRSAAPHLNEQIMSNLLVIRGSESEIRPTHSPPNSLRAPADVAQGRRMGRQQLSSRQSDTSTQWRLRLQQLRQWQSSWHSESATHTEDSNSTGAEYGSRDLSFYRNRFEEPMLSPVSARASEFSLPDNDTRRSLRGYSTTTTATTRNQNNDPIAAVSSISPSSQTTNPYYTSDDVERFRLHDIDDRSNVSTRAQNRAQNQSIQARRAQGQQTRTQRTRSPSDYYIFNLDDNDSTTDEGGSPVQVWRRRGV